MNTPITPAPKFKVGSFYRQRDGILVSVDEIYDRLPDCVLVSGPGFNGRSVKSYGGGRSPTTGRYTHGGGRDQPGDLMPGEVDAKGNPLTPTPEPLFKVGSFYRQRDGNVRSIKHIVPVGDVRSPRLDMLKTYCDVVFVGTDHSDGWRNFATGKYELNSNDCGSDLMPGEVDANGKPLTPLNASQPVEVETTQGNIMKISDLIDQLQGIQDDQGNLDVVVRGNAVKGIADAADVRVVKTAKRQAVFIGKAVITAPQE